jgi:hypothetical protein
MEPVRNFLRHKKATVKFYEAEATKIDYKRKVVMINDESEIKGDISATEVPFDMLVVGVGAENATFGEQHGLKLLLSNAYDFQVFRGFESILSFSRRSTMLKPSGDVLWTAARPRPSKTRLPKRSNGCFTWLSSEAAQQVSNLRASCRTFSLMTCRSGFPISKRTSMSLS